MALHYLMFTKRFLHSPRASLEDANIPVLRGREQIFPVVEEHSRIDLERRVPNSSFLPLCRHLQEISGSCQSGCFTYSFFLLVGVARWEVVSHRSVVMMEVSVLRAVAQVENFDEFRERLFANSTRTGYFVVLICTKF